MKHRMIVAMGAVVGLTLGGAVACEGTDSSTGTEQPPTAVEEIEKELKEAEDELSGLEKEREDLDKLAADGETKPAGPLTEFTSGTFLVGTDIKAGTYKTPGPPTDDILDYCYWERSKDDSGELDKIITNEIVEGPGRVTVQTGEVFNTTGECEWKKV